MFLVAAHLGSPRQRAIKWVLLLFPLKSTPFPPVDIIGAVVIVWRVRGKIIRSVLCSIVYNSCAQCSAHTHEQTSNSCLLVRFSFFVVILYVTVRLC